MDIRLDQHSLILSPRRKSTFWNFDVFVQDLLNAPHTATYKEEKRPNLDFRFDSCLHPEQCLNMVVGSSSPLLGHVWDSTDVSGNNPPTLLSINHNLTWPTFTPTPTIGRGGWVDAQKRVFLNTFHQI